MQSSQYPSPCSQDAVRLTHAGLQTIVIPDCPLFLSSSVLHEHMQSKNAVDAETKRPQSIPGRSRASARTKWQTLADVHCRPGPALRHLIQSKIAASPTTEPKRIINSSIEGEMPSKLHTLLEHGALARPAALKDVTGDFFVDEALVHVLPKDFTLLSAEPFAKSDFSITGRLQGQMPDGSTQEYFIKCASDDRGKTMLHGEYVSLCTIDNACPGLVPRVLGWGEFQASPPDLSIYFLIEDFLPLSQTPPEPARLAARIAAMHLHGHSPDGQFGFPVVTCDGPLAHPNAWKTSWSEFYAELLRTRVRMDAEACGRWPELERAAEHVITKVVPRLLEDLTWQGKPIEPSLIHGDLWDANVGTLKTTGEPIIYDAGCYYAHNEMETAIWRVVYAEVLGQSVYRDAYLRLYPPAEPADEWDDRNRLYSLKCNLNWSATDPGIITRKIAYNDMCYLSAKYAPLDGIAAYDPALDPTVVGIAQVKDHLA